MGSASLSVIPPTAPSEAKYEIQLVQQVRQVTVLAATSEQHLAVVMEARSTAERLHREGVRGVVRVENVECRGNPYAPEFIIDEVGVRARELTGGYTRKSRSHRR